MKRLCITCGKELEGNAFSNGCEAGHNVVSQEPCYQCGKLVGVVAVDDYSGVEMVICPDCLDKVRC